VIETLNILATGHSFVTHFPSPKPKGRRSGELTLDRLAQLMDNRRVGMNKGASPNE
jgi:hypothetical protein